jgi:hypothetical protein
MKEVKRNQRGKQKRKTGNGRDKDSKRNLDRNKVRRRKDRNKEEIWSWLLSSHCPVFVCACMGFVVFTARGGGQLCCDLVVCEPWGSLEGACRNIARRAHCLHFQDKAPPLFYPENGSSMLPRNIGNHTQDHTVS